MQTVFIFFIVVNIAFFAWQSDLSGGERTQQDKALTAIPGNVSPLVMLKGESSESPRSIDIPAEPEPKITKPQQTALLTPPLPAQQRTATDYKCYSLGPFREVSLSTPIAGKLRKLGAITRQRREEEKIISGYWVYLPRMDTWKEARETVMGLESKGMKDIFIVGRGSMKNAVSVGLFSSQKAADKRVAHLNSLGEAPLVQPQHSTTPKYWVDIDVEAGGEKATQAIKKVANSLTEIKLETRKCKN